MIPSLITGPRDMGRASAVSSCSRDRIRRCPQKARPTSLDPVIALVEEVTILIRQVRLCGLNIEGDTQTGPIPHVDKTMIDDWVR